MKKILFIALLASLALHESPTQAYVGFGIGFGGGYPYGGYYGGYPYGGYPYAYPPVYAAPAYVPYPVYRGYQGPVTLPGQTEEEAQYPQQHYQQQQPQQRQTPYPQQQPPQQQYPQQQPTQQQVPATIK